MQKMSVFLVACLFWGGTLHSVALAAGDSPDSDAASHPKVQFERNSYDFGDVYRGDKVKYRFSYVNSGDGPLVVQGIHAACGCTAVEAEKGRPFSPGESGEIEVTLDTTNFTGPITKVITVMTNEKHIPDRALTVRANIRDEIAADPPLADFGEVRSKDGGEQQVTIKSVAKMPVDISSLRFNKDVMEAVLTKDPTGKFWTLRVKLLKGIRTGFLKETVYARTTSTHIKELPIPVRANIKGNIEAFPQYLEFGAISRGEQSRRSVTLRVDGEFTLKGAKTFMNLNGESLKDVESFVTVSPIQDVGGKKTVSIELKNSSKGAGSVHGKLVLETTDPQQKELPVDFYAFFR